MSSHIRRKGRTSQSAAIVAASILELHLFTRSAQAQEATGDVSAFQDIASVDGVASVETLDDGRVEITMEDGSVLMVPAGEVQILNGTVFVSDSFLIAQGLTASPSNNTVLLLTLGAVGAAVAVNALESSGDSDDDVAPPVATPPPPPPPPMPPVFTSSATADVAENQTDAYRAVATDADSDTLSYSLSGTDASRFMIDAATGEVSFIEAPDFEAPGDADADNVYDIIVTASDGANTAERTVAIMVTDENEAPIFTSDAAVSVAENQTAAYAAVATDADGNDLSYNLSGTDAALFMIDGATGEVRFIEAPDFENPGDADGDNIYDIVVTASDGTNSTDQAVAITVTDENDGTAFQRLLDNPEEASVADFDAAGIERVNALTLDAARGLLQAVGEDDPATLASLTPQQVQAITDIARDHIVSISGPEDAGIYDSGEFTLGSNPAIVSVEAGSFIVALDYDRDGETDHIANIEFDADYRVQRVERDFGADNAPDDPPDVVETVERPDDRMVQISYDIREDGDTDRGDTDRIETYTLDENGDRIQVDVDTDADGNTDRVESYEIDADGNRIQIDFDDNADGATDRIEISTYDESGNRVQTDFDDDADGTIDRTEDIADAAPVFTSPATANVAENRTEAYTAIATDADSDALTYSLSGADAALFTIDPDTGVVSFITPPDFETPGDDGRNNVYDITVTASDGDNSTDQNVAITVTNVFDPTQSMVSLALINAYDGTADTAQPMVEDYASAGVEVLARNLAGANAVVAATNAGGVNLTPAQLENLAGLADDYIRLETTDVTVTFDSGTYTIAEDVDGNGTADRISTVNVNANGNVLYAGVDFDADGDAERTVTYTLDANGNAVVAQFDDNAADGFERTETRTYDANGNATFVQFDDNPAATDGFERTETRTYDENDNPVFVEFDDDADGTTDRTVAQTHDSFGQITLAEFDEDSDGIVDRTVSQTFNDLGQITRREFDTDNDGNTDRSDAATFNNLGQVTFREFDDDGDGGVDRTETQTFNALGQVTGRGLDDDADGAVDRTITQTFNDLWQLTRLAVDENNDGTVDRSSTRMYNDLGQLALLQADLDNDGTFDRIDTYNALGQIALRQFDTSDDGTIDRTEALTYNDQGQVTLREFDNNVDGTIDQSQTRVYNAEGLLERVDADFDNDGNIDRIDTYNALGQITSQAFDTNDDGTVDSTEALTYNAQGQLTRREFDNDGDGTIDQSQTRAYSAGLLERVDADLDNDGNIDRADTYNAQGQIISQAFDTDDDGNVNRRDTFNAQGQLTRREVDDNDNGTFDRIRSQEFNANGLLARVEIDNNADGNADRIEVYTYDGSGNLIRTDFDDDGDGTIDRTDPPIVANTPPVFSSPASASVAENQASAYTAVATDVDGDSLTYGLSGTDAGLFTINETTGVVTFEIPPDFEMPGDADSDNVYDIIVTASDNTNETEHAVAITVTNDNDNRPSFTPPGSVSVDVEENQTAAYTAVAMDADGMTPTYGLSGTDATLFTIDPNTGVVSFLVAPDFEMPGDEGGDNVYNINVTATDGTNERTQAVAITVTDVDDGPLALINAYDGTGTPLTVADYAAAGVAVFERDLAGTNAVVAAANGVGADVTLTVLENLVEIADDYIRPETMAVTVTFNTPTTGATFTITEDVDGNGSPDRISAVTVDADGNVMSASVDLDADGTAERTVSYTLDTNGNAIMAQFDDNAAAADGIERSETWTVDENGNATFVQFDDNPAATDGFERTETRTYDANGNATFVQFDDDADGIVDRTVALTRDSFGQITLAEFDEDDDGTVDRTVTQTFNDLGQITRRDFDRDNDGNTDRSDAATFNNLGQVEFRAFDDDGNGSNDRTETQTFNALGQVTGRGLDDDADGFVDRTITQTFNDLWQLTRLDVDENNDDTVDRSSTRMYNDLGQLALLQADLDNDGTIDRIDTYNALGQIALRQFDTNDDGTIDRTEALTYNAQGQVTRREFDNDGDGITDQSQTRAYSAEGLLERVDADLDNDGTVDRADTYNAQGRIISQAFDTDDDGNVNRRDTFNAQGQLTRREVDDNDNGTFDRIRSQEFNGEGLLARVEIDNNADGTADRIEIYTYNEDGDLVRTDFDDDADGTIDRTDPPVVANTPPVFTSPASVNVAENEAEAYTAVATDVDGDSLTYSLSGVDAGLFTINPNTGVVSFNNAPDFESPGSATDDNDYNIIVTASDGASDAERAVTITVTDVDEATQSMVALTLINAYDGTADTTQPTVANYAAAGVDVLARDLAGTNAVVAAANASGLDLTSAQLENLAEIADDYIRPETMDVTVTFGSNTYTITEDVDGDGSSDRISTVNVDANGNVVSASVDLDANGTAEQTVSYTLDANGNATMAQFDDNTAADDGLERTETRMYDENDNPVFVQFNDNAVGGFERTETRMYDANDNPVFVQFDDNAAAGDGFERTETRMYDANDNPVFVQFDDNADGVADRTEAQTFNDLGQVTRIELDDDNDGNVDRTEAQTFNDLGQVTRIELDDDNDGNVDRTIAQTHDDFDQITFRAFDENNDGTVDRTVALTYNDLGQVTRREFDDDNDGNVDRTEAETFNDLGQTTRRELDDNNDGNVDRTLAQTFNDLGQVTRREFDDDNDSNVDRTEAETFNDLGQATRRELDNDADGTVDRTLTQTFNALGQVTLLEFDDDNDGDVDRTEAQTFNALGQVTRREFDDDADSTVERTTAWTYNDLGQITFREFDDNDDGIVERTQAETFNALGQATLRELDDNADGTVDRTLAQTFNDLGQATRREFDDDNDGTVDRTEAQTFNALGQITRRELDNDADGTVDRTTTQTFNDLGQLVRREFDDDNDGTVDRVEEQTFNALGQVTRRELDNDNDGTADRITTQTFNDLGQLVRREFDDDNDGNVDRTLAQTFNDLGQVTLREFDDDADGNVDRTAARAYSDLGRLARVDSDFDNDGNIDRVDTYNADGAVERREFYTYNEFSDRVRAEFDDDADGTLDRIEQYTVNSDGVRQRTDFDNDADGNIDRSEIDFEGDGNPERIEIYTYDGDGNLVRTDFDDDADGTIDRTDPPVVANAPPVFTSPASVSVAENQTSAYTAAATDADGDSLTYSLSGTDAALFTINATTGVVSFNNPPDFESPGSGTGDNVYDIIVTASDGTSDTERAVTITVTDVVNEGSVSSPLTDLSMLDGSNGFILNGIVRSGLSGGSVSSAGDVNGDGYDDLIIGADGANVGENNTAGETYVVYGGPAGTVFSLARSTLDGTNGFTVTGISQYDRSGNSVSSAGDVNGDGYDDLIIGSQEADQGGNSNAGETYVVYGGASAPGTAGVLALSALDGTNGFMLNGIAANDRSGVSVSSAGDVNGDGYDDLIIGARQADPGGNSNAGETYVVYGGASAPGTGGVLALSALDGTNGFTLNGIDADDRSGVSVSSAGDINGDGYDDLVIGARRADPGGNDRAGESYVVYGGASAPGTGGVLALSALDGTNGFTLNGIDERDDTGFSVSSAGDVNGDGYDDLIIGARYGDPNGNYSGETYVVYGGASAPGAAGVLALSALDGTNGFILNGIDARDRAGWSVSSAGDINGDGYDDLIIGALRAYPGGNRYAGETYVIYGGASTPGTGGELELSALDGTNGFTLNGIDAYDLSGSSVSSAGDVNGDGYDDLIIGAPSAEPVGVNSGETYVVYGGATGTESTVAITAQGTVAADNFTGNAGADSFTGIATGDVVRGGAGDDSISVTALDFADIGGGTGRDTLVLAGADLSLDLTGAGNGGVDSVEVFDLSGTGANTLVLDALAVFDLTEERDGGMATLDVLGDANDRVDLSGGNFTSNGTATEDGTTYNVYQDGNAEVRVQNGVVVTLVPAAANTPPVFTSPASVSVAENQTSAYTAAATDADGDSLTYSLSGTDAALFTINATTGVVSFNNPPDFESPGSGTGDNVYDIIVTASDGTSDTERAVTITVTDVVNEGSVSSPLTDLSMLDGSNGFTVHGIGDGSAIGYSVSSAGDVNGDGYDDLIISGEGNGTTGEAFVVYGASVPGTDGVLALSGLDGSNGFRLNGIDEFDRAGYSVSSAGDVNGDGYDDLIIGAHGAGSMPPAPGDYDRIAGPGETYVVYGGASAPGSGGVLALSALDGSNGFRLDGIDGGDNAGYSVSSAGDVNGDGYDDLIIGANQADPNGSRSGETYVVYGGASAPDTAGVLALSALDGSNGFRLDGIDRGDRAGYSVSSAGDVNGDGYDDLIIGAYEADPGGNDNAGETYVVYGGASAPGTDGVLALSALDGSNGFRLDGIDGNDRSGASVSSAGDVNGDGYDDLIIGANQADPGGRDLAGETYLVYGGASAPGSGGVLALSALDGTNGFILNGVDPSDRSSRSVSSAGDVNGDGYDDLIIGAYAADPGGNSGAGESYVVYGGASAPGTGGVLALSALDGTNGFTLNGINADDRAGISVSAAGDVNGDGYDDLIIGADEADVGVNGNAGETYVVYGGATGTESTVAVTAAGTAAVDNFTGNAGADSFTGIATGDVVRGGAGDDSISVTALDFADIDGGTGQDTLVLAGADLSLDLTGAGNGGVDSVEVFDLTGTGANTLVLDVQAVFDLTEERTGGMATLDVVGDANDTVDLSGGNFALSGRATEDGTTYNVFNDGNVELRIQNGVLVTLGTTSSGLLSEEPVFEDLSVRDSIPDMQDTGEDAVVLMPLPVTALAPMASPVFAGDKQLQNDLAMILQDMEVFADPVTNGDTDMDGF